MAQSNVENLSPHVIRQIYKELCELTQNPPEGIRVVYNEEDITCVQADIDGPLDTPYFGGSFRIRLQMGKGFPATPPKGYFVTKIFHPNVGRNGEICVNTLKKDWNQDLGIKHILLTIKCLLIVPNPESALNEEAGKMLLERYEDYCKRAKMFTEIHAPRAKIISNLNHNNNNNDCLSAPSSSSVSNNNNNHHSNNSNSNTTLSDKTTVPSPQSQLTNNKATAASCDSLQQQSPQAGVGAQKHALDGICCSEEPASKRLNTLIDCYNSTADQLDPSIGSQQQQQQSQQQQQQSTSLKTSQSSTATPATASSNQVNSSKQPAQSKYSGSSITDKNRGLKRVLRLRS